MAYELMVLLLMPCTGSKEGIVKSHKISLESPGKKNIQSYWHRKNNTLVMFGIKNRPTKFCTVLGLDVLDRQPMDVSMGGGGGEGVGLTHLTAT